MAKKLTRSKLVKKLDNIFSQYIRLSNSVNDIAECVTCNKKDHWKKMQCGHFQSRKHYSTRWDESNVAVQCAGCNVFRYGEQYKFSLYLGKNLSQKLLDKSRKVVKFADVDLLEMIDYYSDKLKLLL